MNLICPDNRSFPEGNKRSLERQHQNVQVFKGNEKKYSRRFYPVLSKHILYDFLLNKMMIIIES